jgi:hypothetical protein
MALRSGLDSFGNHLQSQFVCHHDDGLAQSHVIRGGGQVANEAAVDLDVVDVEFLEIGQ